MCGSKARRARRHPATGHRVRSRGSRVFPNPLRKHATGNAA
jgi:hypothetical protein